MSVRLEPSSADMLECVAVEIPQVVRKGLYCGVVVCQYELHFANLMLIVLLDDYKSWSVVCVESRLACKIIG